ncbi:hypothethical protein (plasmid) [Ralstonia solanacearum CMR15]|nr:hypothethical protein [Ralstonia solanacearum CMR15]
MSMKYSERFKACLINPTQDEIFERDPVSVFSFYLAGRVCVLSKFADEIIENLEIGFSSQQIDGSRIVRSESLMWLRVLGAYEVVRTMHQAKGCFSDRVVADLGILKKQLSVVRMPAAKMEKVGQKLPVTSNRSACGWDASKRDLLINDPDDSVTIQARFILAEFDRVFCGIRRDDVLAAHELSYSSPCNTSTAG